MFFRATQTRSGRYNRTVRSRASQTLEGASNRDRDGALERVRQTAAACAARGTSPKERVLRLARADAQLAEDADVQRRALRLIAALTATGRADGREQAELMFQRLGRARLPAGNMVATRILVGQMNKKSRRRVTGKQQSRGGGRRWSKGLHPGLWYKSDISVTEPAYVSTPQHLPSTPIGIVAIR